MKSWTQPRTFETVWGLTRFNGSLWFGFSGSFWFGYDRKILIWMFDFHCIPLFSSFDVGLATDVHSLWAATSYKERHGAPSASSQSNCVGHEHIMRNYFEGRGPLEARGERIVVNRLNLQMSLLWPLSFSAETILVAMFLGRPSLPGTDVSETYR